MSSIDPDINRFGGNLVTLHTIVDGACRLNKLELSADNVKKMGETVSSWLQSVENLREPLTVTPIKDRPNLPLCRKIRRLHDDVGVCSAKLEGLVVSLQQKSQEGLAVKDLVADLERLRRNLKDMDDLLTQDSLPLPSIPERAEPLDLRLPKAKATKTTRLLAIRDVLFGSAIAAAKEFLSIPFKAVFLYVSTVLEAYIRLGLWNGTKASLEVLVLIARKTIGALLKTIVKLPYNQVLATAGIIKPSLWVNITKVKEKGVESFSPLRSVTTGVFGVLCPEDGHVFGYQKDTNGDQRLMEYTTLLERDADSAGQHWFDFNERANRLIASQDL